MLPRLLRETLLARAEAFPAVAITGPRQSGKTTLIRSAFPEKPYVSLEDPDRRAYAESDPRGFLSEFPNGAVFDEVQRVPQLFSYLQGMLDSAKRMGLFILSGSQNFLLMEQLTQSLAGRIGLLNLLPFSLSEAYRGQAQHKALDEVLWKGLYPPLFDRKVGPTEWYAAYVETYLEKDLRPLRNVHDLRQFRTFLKLCAGRNGQLVNLSSLGADAGLNHVTVKAWLSLLESSYLIRLVSPYFEHFNKRLVKAPRLYFYDTGLAAYLLGIREPGQLTGHPLRGALFEALIYSELSKGYLHRGVEAPLYFWRDRTGHEVDALLDTPGGLKAIEIKAAQTVDGGFFSSLTYFRKLAAKKTVKSSLVYGGNERQNRSVGQVLPWFEAHTLSS